MPSANRRDFLKTTAAVGAAVTLTAASYDRVYGANGRIGVGFVGVGGRCQAHLDVVNKLAKENKGAAPVAVCDVWDGLEKEYESGGRKRTYLQGLYPSAKKVGLDPDDRSLVERPGDSEHWCLAACPTPDEGAGVIPVSERVRDGTVTASRPTWRPRIRRRRAACFRA